MTLLQAELVMLQEVPRTADRNPKTTFYLWHVSLPHAYRVLEAEMLRTLDQLRAPARHIPAGPLPPPRRAHCARHPCRAHCFGHASDSHMAFPYLTRTWRSLICLMLPLRRRWF